jgi:hypothetical protein
VVRRPEGRVRGLGEHGERVFVALIFVRARRGVRGRRRTGSRRAPGPSAATRSKLP